MAKVSASGPNNLPISLTSFIGRTREIAEVKRLLARTRLLTLTGAGGCGKTRLALQVAADLLPNYAEGVWIVDLAALAEPNLVPQIVASALGVREHPGRPLTSTLVDSLRSKTLLLLLDNCEHLLPACAHLADALVRECGDLRILATGREGLSIEGEAQYPVPPLSTPDPQRVGSAEDLTRYDAARLFVERAVAAQPAFAPTAENAQAIARLVCHLDGIPLAIELAAARVKALAVEQIVARLYDRFGLLTGGSRTGLPRHRTLRMAIDWSYDLLSESERMLLRRVSVFGGGWTLEAAEAVCSGRGVEPAEVLDLMTQVVAKSLAVADIREGAARYRLLETVRQYGRARLQEAGEEEKFASRHLDFFLNLAEQAEPHLEGAEQTVWFNRLEAEHDNLGEALAWSVRSAPEKGLRLAGALGRFWLVRCHFTEGRGWLKEALEKDAGESAPLRAKALNWAGWLARRQRDYAAARPLHEESLALYRELGDKRGIADSTCHLGMSAMNEADHGSAVAFFQESLAIFRQLGYEQGILEALGDLGHATWHQGDHAAARPLLEEAVALARKSGQTSVLVYALWCLGLVAFDQHNYGEAHSLYAEGLAAAKELGDTYWRINLVEAFAALVAAEGQYVRAARLLAAADANRKAEGIPLGFAHRSDYDRPVATIRAGLNEEAFAAAWAEGRAMTLEQATEDALTPAEAQRSTEAATVRAPGGGADILTQREQEVATLIAQGLTNREIASRLKITERTAETHVRNILNKVNANSRTQIAVWALAHGLQSPTFPQ